MRSSSHWRQRLEPRPLVLLIFMLLGFDARSPHRVVINCCGECQGELEWDKTCSRLEIRSWELKSFGDEVSLSRILQELKEEGCRGAEMRDAFRMLWGVTPALFPSCEPFDDSEWVAKCRGKFWMKIRMGNRKRPGLDQLGDYYCLGERDLRDTRVFTVFP